MATELFNNDKHLCLMFSDLVEDGGDAVQANQFLIIDHGEGAIIDPGGNMTFNELTLTMRRYMAPQDLRYILASHADPDIIASLDRWMTSSQAKLVISRLWARFAPHFCKVGKTDNRIIGVPDAGGLLRLGTKDIVLLPAHFMHAEGNFQFYDPVSKILFSGDLGVSMVSGEQAKHPFTDLSAALPAMEAFHRRYMVSNKILRLWAQMVRELDIEMIVPQHGAPIKGKPAVAQFIQWAENLACGIDLMGSGNYRVPTQAVPLLAES
ncbi:metallo-beta-lactamase superfamily protein [mine drainage metagenome]|uniref:Metallo-beta-lactamase superfamily protein n=1 Tax=mine drainage metagenome TaxID=410659 RepID=A0A1J5Q1K2_9ZZZZ